MSRKVKTKKHLAKKNRERKRQRELNGLVRNRIVHRGVQRIVDQAESLFEDGENDAARELLEELNENRTINDHGLRLLLDILYNQQDGNEYCRVATQLTKQYPHQPEYCLMQAAGYMMAMMPANSLVTYEKFFLRWPSHPATNIAREEAAKIRPALNEMWKDWPHPDYPPLAPSAINERMYFGIACAEFDEVIRLGESALRDYPKFVPAQNNLSEALFQRGHFERSFEVCRNVLKLDPGNIFAQANLARYLYLGGRMDEAQELACRLANQRPTAPDQCCKIAETLSFIGEHEGVLEVMAIALQNKLLEHRTPADSLLYHLAGAAAARMNDWTSAKKYWRRAMDAKDLSMARDNLEDLRLPVGERNGPWAFELSHWVPVHLLENLRERLEKAVQNSESDRKQKFVQSELLDVHPHILGLVPEMLERGDATAKSFAILVAQLLRTPELDQALVTFSQSRNGSDSVRMNLVHWLRMNELIPATRQPMFLKGNPVEIEIECFCVTDEPTIPESRSPRVQELVEEAMDALYASDGELAEELYGEAIEMEPDAPDLYNNLAMALQMQGRNEESDELLQQIGQRWPDYFFGQIASANRATNERRLDDATELLAKLGGRELYHRTEFSALCIAHLRLGIAKPDLPSAERWIGLWERLVPDHPEISRWKKTLNRVRPIAKLINWMTPKGNR